ncbi:helix-turn-helix domain-containing protein [Pseudobacteroides cellulosolvens]|uniref:Helix-turn-helix domain protein n=1 Tax=Pseudobacteroides cellulosolvens ATCC 35603 = DSM 2933 TaxID=398512 RepID=A0A0L6JR08_9FIRM|nr:helix-turn-helix transcriptional regulator [Pseudobacteroides cellulosolvens]KNY28214.1 helix-turn-helix domain protein [Pseudobacteroides cellulosolvens ATCC 35603 = DSM 2933]
MGHLSNLIKTRRQSAGFSLREFSEKCGLSHTYIKNLEETDPRTGKEIVPTVESLDKIARALNMTLEELLKEIGYIKKDTNLSFEGSNLKMIRGSKSYKDITDDIFLKTNRKIDPSIYEDMEKGNDESPSPILVDILANYSGVDRSFFYRRNNPDDLRRAQLIDPYRVYDDHKKSPLDHIKNAELKEFIENPENVDYLLLAKELKSKKIKVKFIRDMIFDD